jgi:ADP-heptose:LPS heptosyltransferase
VLRPGALGDALVAFPVLQHVKSLWSEASITLIARADVLELAHANGLAETTYPYDLPVWSGLWSDLSRVDPLLRATVSEADAVIAWIGDADGTIARHLEALGARRWVVAPGRPAVGSDEHVALYLVRTLTPLGLPVGPQDVTELAQRIAPLVPPSGALAAAEATWDALRFRQQRVVALHPGSGGLWKCWAPERFARLAASLWSWQVTPLLLAGQADEVAVRAVERELADILPGTTVPVARGLSVAVLAGVLARCGGYVGNDSGVTHLAGLLGLPTLALFGPSDPAIWSPLARQISVLQARADGLAPMDELDEADVAAALRAVLDSDA